MDVRNRETWPPGLLDEFIAGLSSITAPAGQMQNLPTPTGSTGSGPTTAAPIQHESRQGQSTMSMPTATGSNQTHIWNNSDSQVASFNPQMQVNQPCTQYVYTNMMGGQGTPGDCPYNTDPQGQYNVFNNDSSPHHNVQSQEQYGPSGHTNTPDSMGTANSAPESSSYPEQAIATSAMYDTQPPQSYNCPQGSDSSTGVFADHYPQNDQFIMTSSEQHDNCGYNGPDEASWASTQSHPQHSPGNFNSAYYLSERPYESTDQTDYNGHQLGRRRDFRSRSNRNTRNTLMARRQQAADNFPMKYHNLESHSWAAKASYLNPLMIEAHSAIDPPPHIIDPDFQGYPGPSFGDPRYMFAFSSHGGPVRAQSRPCMRICRHQPINPPLTIGSPGNTTLGIMGPWFAMPLGQCNGVRRCLAWD